MERVNFTLVVSGLLCVVFLCPASAGTVGTLYKLKDAQNNTCALLQVQFTVVITAFKGGKFLAYVPFSEIGIANTISGDCLVLLNLNLNGVASWTFYEYLRFGRRIDHMMTREVTFIPFKVFGHIAPSNKTYVFGTPKDEVIGAPDQSYLCGYEDRRFYIPIGTESTKADARSKITDEDITFSVFVDVKFLHIQFSKVVGGKFGEAVKCPQPK